MHPHSTPTPPSTDIYGERRSLTYIQEASERVINLSGNFAPESIENMLKYVYGVGKSPPPRRRHPSRPLR